MVSVKLDHHAFGDCAKVKVTITDLPWLSPYKIKVINEIFLGREVYTFIWVSGFNSTATHTFMTNRAMTGINKLVVEVFDWFGNLKSKAETTFVVIPMGRPNNCPDPMWLIIYNYLPYLAIIGFALIILLILKR